MLGNGNGDGASSGTAMMALLRSELPVEPAYALEACARAGNFRRGATLYRQLEGTLRELGQPAFGVQPVPCRVTVPPLSPATPLPLAMPLPYAPVLLYTWLEERFSVASFAM